MPVPSRTTSRVNTPPKRRSHRALSLLRRVWRGGVRERWRSVRVPVLLGIGIESLILGTIGFLQLKSVMPRYGLLDSAYRALTLFTLGGAAPPKIPVTLQIARITAPLLTGYAAIGTVLALTRVQARVLAIRLFVRNHVIIAGLGETGRRLADALVDQVPVVAIESSLTNEHLPSARLRGVRTLIGSAGDPTLLRQAGIQHARTLVVVCGPGGTNVDVAAAAAGALEGRHQPLTIFVHLNNLDLWSSLAAEGATFQSHRSEIRLEYFNVLAIGAQLLLERESPFRHTQPGSEPWTGHILLVGLEGVGEQLVLQLARLWGARGPDRRSQLRITVTGADAERDLAELLERHPALDHYCALAARPLAIESAAFQSGAAMAGPDGACDVSRAYVSLVDEGDALLAALALHARPDAAHVPVTVAVSDAGAGVSVILGSDRGRFGSIRSFGVLSEATNGDLLLRGTNELLARAQHAQWLRRQQRAGQPPPDNPNLKPWEHLNEAQRENNRRFADDLHAKLARVHCMLVPMPLPDPDAPAFAFNPEELEALSRHEHVRWMDAMRDAGWRYGEPRDNDNKIHDQLKPWEELDELNRDKDRDAVREIPRMLARAGFAIQRGDAA